MICGSSFAISIINVAIVFADALSACAATKFVSQISLNEDFDFKTTQNIWTNFNNSIANDVSW